MFPSSSSSSPSSCKAFLHKGPKVLFLDHLKIHSSVKCLERTLGAVGCVQEVVVNKTMLTHIKWVPRHVINSYPGGSFWGKFAFLGGDVAEVGIACYGTCSWATSPTLILRCFLATGSLVLNSWSHFLVICGKIHSLRWSLHLGAAPYIRFHLLWVMCFTKANPQDLMKRKDFSLIQASWWDFFRWFQSSFRWCIFTSFFNRWYLYTTVW